LTVLATADEESGMFGARALAEAGRPLGRFAVIGEPTSLRPVRMHKGVMMEAIRITGRSGHSSNPALGVSALEAMHRVIGELLAWRTEMQTRYRQPMFEVPVPTLNLGHIHGGDSPNRICGNCELHIDMRTLPGMDQAELRGLMQARLQKSVEGIDVTLDAAPLFPSVPAMESAADATLVRATEELTGTQAGIVAFGTEGPFLQSLGMETVVLGPGSIDQAHQPDEFLPLDAITPTLNILDALVARFCLEGDGSQR
jgi:acetylornithine deacetylase